MRSTAPTIRVVATPTGQAVTGLLSMSVMSWSRPGADDVSAREPAGKQPDLWPLRDAGYVARLLGIPRKSVLEYAREGKLPCVRIGRHVRFVIADVQAAVDAQRPSGRRA
jgi:excisionase family DNA binding protein